MNKHDKYYDRYGNEVLKPALGKGLANRTFFRKLGGEIVYDPLSNEIRIAGNLSKISPVDLVRVRSELQCVLRHFSTIAGDWHNLIIAVLQARHKASGPDDVVHIDRHGYTMTSFNPADDSLFEGLRVMAIELSWPSFNVVWTGRQIIENPQECIDDWAADGGLFITYRKGGTVEWFETLGKG